ncbi:MAG: hypothetical protein M5U34_32050 [Chloroflexi bacterium]|nr:hypothetical protein [Chloroflexota bacterium]
MLLSACERLAPQVSVIDVNRENPAVIGEASPALPPDGVAVTEAPPTPIMPEMRLPTRAVYNGDPRQTHPIPAWKIWKTAWLPMWLIRGDAGFHRPVVWG